MKTAIRSFAIVVAAALSFPAFASESAISGDPTWPAIENPAPAIVVRGPARVAAVDLSNPDVKGNAPALAAVAYEADGRSTEPALPAPEVHTAVFVTAPPAHVAAR